MLLNFIIQITKAKFEEKISIFYIFKHNQVRNVQTIQDQYLSYIALSREEKQSLKRIIAIFYTLITYAIKNSTYRPRTKFVLHTLIVLTCLNITKKPTEPSKEFYPVYHEERKKRN